MENSDKVQIDYEELAKLKAETLEKANRDAESIIADAREKSINIIAEARVQGEAVVTEAEELARSVRDKILTEAASKAESIIKEAQARTEETRRSAETMGAAAMKMYGEVLSFRDTLFEAYNIHIESIEEIIETADELFGDEEEAEAEASDAVTEESESEPVTQTEDFEDDELLGTVDISEYGEMLESLEEEAGELRLDMSEFREIIDELPMSEAASALEDDFVVVGEGETVEYGADIEEANDFETVTDVEDEFDTVSAEETEPVDVPAVTADDEWISAEEWDAENSGEYTDDYDAAAEEYAVETDFEGETYADETAEYVTDYPEEIPGDAYEAYGELTYEDVADEVDPIELEAQKYSDVYEDDDEGDFYSEKSSEDDEMYSDFGNVEYAPAPEYSWGDDMYVEPEGEEEYTEDYVGGYSENYIEEYDEEFDEDYDDDVEFMEELPAAPVYDEEDELNKLKQFFSADFDDAAAKRQTYDTASNSTTSIALSLNDFFEDGADLSEDYGYGTDDDMESLFEKKDMSITDEFDIVFGKMDSAKSVDEIRRQPIIAPKEPKKHKKHKKF